MLRFFHVGGVARTIRRIRSDIRKNVDLPTSQSYQPNAVVPLPNTILGSLTTEPFKGASWNPSEEIVVGRFPRPIGFLAEKLHELRADISDRMEVFSHPGSGEAVEWIEKNLTAFLSTCRSWERLGLLHSPPNCLTTTFDFDAEAYVGIHLDDWDHLPFKDRTSARSRFLMNLALEDRRFYVVDLLAALFSQPDELETPTTTFRRLQKITKAPVYEVVLQTGDWIVLNAENIPHDGGSLGSQATGLAYTLLFSGGDIGALLNQR